MDINQFIIGNIDIEYQQYKLLAYIQDIKSNFDKFILYPYINDIEFHYKNLLMFLENKKILRSKFSTDYSKLDKFVISDNKLIIPKIGDSFLDDLDEFLEQSLKQMKLILDQANEIKIKLLNDIVVEPFGILSTYKLDGIVLIKNSIYRFVNLIDLRYEFYSVYTEDNFTKIKSEYTNPPIYIIKTTQNINTNTILELSKDKLKDILTNQ